MKNFENEYREMIQEEMPDLWGRIEAGLVEKQPVSMGNETEEEEVLEQNRSIIMYKVLKYSGLAAACICGVIVLPAMLLLNMGGSYSDEAATACTEAMTEEAFTAEMPVEETAATEEAPAEMAEAEKAVTMEEAPAEMAEAEKAVAMEGAPTEMADAKNAVTTEEVPAEEAVMEGAQVEDGAELQLTNGTVLSGITVHISEVETLKYHTIYRAEVIEDENGVLQPEETVEFLAIDDEADPLLVGETYTITLEYDVQAEIPFHLKPKDIDGKE